MFAAHPIQTKKQSDDKLKSILLNLAKSSEGMSKVIEAMAKKQKPNSGEIIKTLISLNKNG